MAQGRPARRPIRVRTAGTSAHRSAQLWQANLAPLVANLYVTALLERRLDEDTARTAEHILNETIEETRRTGMVRSEVVALSLLGH
jgi:hypothetical protein